MRIYDVEIKETYKCIAEIQAESKEQAIRIAKNLYEQGILNIDSDDISSAEYTIIH